MAMSKLEVEREKVRPLKQCNTSKERLAWLCQGWMLSPSEILAGLGTLILALLVYCGLYLLIGKAFLPGGNCWCICIIWLLATAGNWLAERFSFPGVLGMLLSGMAASNINNGHLVRGLPATWSKEIRAIALSIIFLRSGLELDLRIFKKVGLSAIRLLFIPGVVEAFFDGALAIAFFNMPATFAFALGFILKAVGPALVIQCMFERGYLNTDALTAAIPVTVVAAASFDDMIAITGYTLFINLAVTGSGNKTWQIMRGPLSVVLGVLLGMVAALFCGCTKLWNNKYKRTAVVIASALAMKFFFDRYNFESGGALGSLTLGLAVKELWASGQPRWLAHQDSGSDFTRSVEKNVRFVWRFIMMPLLFGIIGASMVFRTLTKSSIPKACAIVIAGLAVRMPTSFLSMFGGQFNHKEKLFLAFAWSPKATVQAALALSPLDAVQLAYPNKNAPGAAQYYEWAHEVVTIAIFCILICATVGTLLIRISAPQLLEKAPPEGDEAAKQTPEAAMVPKLERDSPGPRVHDPLDRQENDDAQLRAARRQQAVEQRLEQDWLQAHADSFEGYLDRIDAVADGLGKGPPEEQSSQLRLMVQDLRQKLYEHDKILPGDVEGADDWMRATVPEHERLRRRPRSGGNQTAESSAASRSMV